LYFLYCFYGKAFASFFRGEKLPDEDTSLVGGLVSKVLEGYSFEGPETLLQKIFTTCAVKPSFDLELCGDKHKLAFAGDGAPLETCASHIGKRVCACKNDLPFLLHLTQASRHDSGTFVAAYA